MKIYITLILLTIILPLFASKKMIIHNSVNNFEIKISQIDSITFEESGPDGMTLIPAKDSSFIMLKYGDSTVEMQQVRFTKDFYMDTTEVTQKQFNDILGSNIERPWIDSIGLGDNYPAYDISWYGAILYCNAKSKKEGKDTVYTYHTAKPNAGYPYPLRLDDINYNANGYRLPTEAEWDYAARGGSDKDYYWNRDYDPYPATVLDSSEIDSYAIWSRNSFNNGIGSSEYGTQKVASKKPNAFGLYDISGNVGEWCSDGGCKYIDSVAIDPINAERYNSLFLARGGDWKSTAKSLSLKNRPQLPSFAHTNRVGFRTVCPK